MRREKEGRRLRQAGKEGKKKKKKKEKSRMDETRGGRGERCGGGTRANREKTAGNEENAQKDGKLERGQTES